MKPILSIAKPHIFNIPHSKYLYSQNSPRIFRSDLRKTNVEINERRMNMLLSDNTKRVIDNFPYTEDMIASNVKPYANCIWNYSISQEGANLIDVDYKSLVLTLLPRTTGKFSRFGLKVNKLRYTNKA